MLSLLSSLTSSTPASADITSSSSSTSNSPAIEISTTSLASSTPPSSSKAEEEDITAYIVSYCQTNRETSFRQKQLIKKALKETPPPLPELGECCGSSCVPCVKDIWLEENRLWWESRGKDVEMPERKVEDMSW